jgi:deoxyinosine 3'endonuclease (endonuclease V)
MLKAAVDVYYKNYGAKAVCILFEHWKDTEASSTHVAYIDLVDNYEPGAFYKRELPCILKVLQQINLTLVDIIIVDGYVYLDDQGKYGLGKHLYEALNKKIPVIGVAKTRFHNNTGHVLEILRGESKNPLFISAIGLDVHLAASNILSMAGEYRTPTLLQYLDQKTRE